MGVGSCTIPFLNSLLHAASAKGWVERPSSLPLQSSSRMLWSRGYLLPQLFIINHGSRQNQRIAEQGSFSTHQVYNEHEKGQKIHRPQETRTREGSFHAQSNSLFLLLAPRVKPFTRRISVRKSIGPSSGRWSLLHLQGS